MSHSKTNRFAPGTDTPLALLTAAAQPASQALPQRLPARALDELLADKESLRVLLFIAQKYSQTFDTVAHRCLSLYREGPLTYLLDFDVIRGHIEKRSADALDTYAVDFIFFRSQIPFAVAPGAWAELLDYFAKHAGIARGLRVAIESMNLEGTVRAIAQTLQITGSDAAHVESVTAEIASRLSQHAVELDRLAALLRNPRFLGVVGEFSEDHRRTWNQLIESMPRRDSGTRDRKDRRDSENLAVASTALHRSGSDAKGGSARYILLSQTGAILKLPRHIDDPDAVRRVQAMLGDPAFIEDSYPVLSPRQALTMELLQAHKSPRAARRRARLFRNDFQSVVDFAEEQLMPEGDTGPSGRPAIAELRAEETDRIREVLKRFREEMLIKSSELRQLEDARATSASIELLRLASRGDPYAHRDLLLERSTDFLRALGQVTCAMAELPDFDYRVVRSAPRRHAPFETILIEQVPSSMTMEPMMRMELYGVGAKKGGGCAYYSARWPVFCSDAAFAAGLRGILEVQRAACERAAGRGTPKLSLEPLDDDNDQFWQEGLIVATSLGDYGASLNWVCADPQLNSLQLSTISALVRDAIPDDRKPRRAFLPEIRRVRVNTGCGDFICDIVPPDGAPHRSVCVLSHLNLARHIAMLYEHTGALFCVADKLEAALKQALSGFPAVSDHSLGGV